MSLHESHPEIIRRLKRANGHLAKVIAMMEAEKECMLVARQLLAVESAVTNAKKALIRDHVDHCLEHAVKNGDKAAVREFKEITKYL